MRNAVDEERFWQAVLEREAALDGAFVYAVRSTGVYCRPICPSRRPRRDQVLFFARPAAAEQAGFRACLRCRPGQPAAPDAHEDLVARACRLIEASPEQPPTLDELGAAVGLSPQHFQRIFKRAMGITPRQYADARRLERLKARLRQGDTVTTALYEAGYGSSSRLYDQAPEQLGMTPATYQRGGAGAQISYALADSPLGRLMVAATARGVCFVSLGDDDAALAGALRDEFPAAEIRRDDDVLDEWVGAILRHLRGEQRQIGLPLDVRATAFQRRVWQALQAIPYGETRTYRQLAVELGQPGAARAVGRACATNPVSLVVPCHRAIGEDGGLRGYRWGLARKQALLEHEREPRTENLERLAR